MKNALRYGAVFLGGTVFGATILINEIVHERLIVANNLDGTVDINYNTVKSGPVD